MDDSASSQLLSYDLYSWYQLILFPNLICCLGIYLLFPKNSHYNLT